jgi:hypothetical protein
VDSWRDKARKELADVYRAVPDLIEAQPRGRQQIGRTKALAQRGRSEAESLDAGEHGAIEHGEGERHAANRRKVQKSAFPRERQQGGGVAGGPGAGERGAPASARSWHTACRDGPAPRCRADQARASAAAGSGRFT